MAPATKTDPVETFKRFFRELMKGYRFNVQGLYLDDSTILPLPKESSLIGKVLEVTIKAHLDRKALSVKGFEFVRGGERSYPDLTIYGDAAGGHRYAIDVKCVRRSKKGTTTQSAMGLATFDATYFREPDKKAANIMAPYNSYDAHLVLVAFYDYEEATARNVELVVVEKWRISSRKKASGTRCYVAAVKEIDRIKKEKGDFASEQEFNEFWRSIPIKEKKPRTKKAKKPRMGAEDPAVG